tara:strand:+ start:634 stop:822 length:189 start_codon:yes stop_codon:yes gene_type:complete
MREKSMKIGDLVKAWLNAEHFEIGVIVGIDRCTLPEKVTVKTLQGEFVEAWDDECEVINAAE